MLRKIDCVVDRDPRSSGGVLNAGLRPAPVWRDETSIAMGMTDTVSEIVLREGGHRRAHDEPVGRSDAGGFNGSDASPRSPAKMNASAPECGMCAHT
jgi:hypothetical protein